MKWDDDLPEDWEDVDDEPPEVETEDLTISRLRAGFVARPADAGVGASDVSIYSTVVEPLEPELGDPA